jgi:hypothetical protein
MDIMLFSLKKEKKILNSLKIKGIWPVPYSFLNGWKLSKKLLGEASSTAR